MEYGLLSFAHVSSAVLTLIPFLVSVDGFMVPKWMLNSFYKYVFHFWDYQKYVFENMMVNELSDRVYECTRLPGGDCSCKWLSG